MQQNMRFQILRKLIQQKINYSYKWERPSGTEITFDVYGTTDNNTDINKRKNFHLNTHQLMRNIY